MNAKVSPSLVDHLTDCAVGIVTSVVTVLSPSAVVVAHALRRLAYKLLESCSLNYLTPLPFC
jgi:hypothetical protein